jgi:ParB-like chromosome segregation protein Spo0J
MFAAGRGNSAMHLISATFVDHDEARLAIEELADGLGVTVDSVAALADVDPPLADPVLVAAHVPDAAEPAARDLLQAHGAAVVSRTAEPEDQPAAIAEPIPIADHLAAVDPV